MPSPRPASAGAPTCVADVLTEVVDAEKQTIKPAERFAAHQAELATQFVEQVRREPVYTTPVLVPGAPGQNAPHIIRPNPKNEIAKKKEAAYKRLLEEYALAQNVSVSLLLFAHSH